MNYRYLFLASLALASSAAAWVAMAPLEVAPPPPGHALFLLSAKAQPERAIEIAEAAVNVRLVGSLAETTVTLVFRNPNSRNMEGELLYPLPPDATLQGYALDVNDRMVDGVPVPKQKARVAFEEEQRKGIDPGLAEWSGGNCFRTRISPIPAHGQRTIRLRYTTLVQQNCYRLPLDYEKVGTFKLRMEAATGEAPQVQPTGLGNLSFVPWQTHFVLEREWKDLALKEDLVIALPQGMAEAPAVEKQGDSFYLAKLIAAPQGAASSLPAADTITLVWDCSASMAVVDKEPIFEALRLYFAANPNCSVCPVFLRNKARPAPEWRVENGDASPLIEALKRLRYDGATAELPADPAWGTGFCLLVTDGHVTIPGEPAAPSAAGQVYALVASSGTDMATLRRWGATPIDLLRQTPAQALANIPAWQLTGVELDGKPWEGALTNAPNGVVDGALLLTGRLPEGKHEVTAIFRSAEGEQRVSFAVDTAGAVEGTLNRSFHAQNALAALLLEPDTPARADKLRQLGEEYGIVTPGTSLLVLENLEQYLRHEVRPPACCPELRACYDEQKATHRRRNAEYRETELRFQKKRTLTDRRRLLAWYGHDFSQPFAPSTEREQLPDLTTAQVGGSEEVNRLLALAYDYYELGKYDEAFETFNRVIEQDPYHSAARRGQEVISRRRADYYRQTHDSYRAHALAEVDALWDEDAEEENVADEDESVAGEVESAEDERVADEVESAEEESVADEDESAEEEGMEEGESRSLELPEGFADGLGAGGSGYGAAPRAENAAASPAIRVQAWSSDAPYLAVLKAAADPVAAYYEQRGQYADSPGFFLDCADFFEQAGNRTMAVQVLSNLPEMAFESRPLLRAAAYKLRYMGETDRAIRLFRKVAELFAEEPQSHRDLALACADAGLWQEAVDALRRVLEQPMDERFRGMEQVAAVELAHIVARAQQAGKPVNTEGLAPEYLKPIECDLRVVINWDTDLSDMDLWVTDPRGEKCYFEHQLTLTGGRISQDVTEGYGPEEFFIRKALPGDYRVQAHYYGTDSMTMLAPVTLYAELYTDYGRPTEKRQTLIFRLGEQDEDVHIADLSHRPDPAAPTTRDYQVRAGDTWESIAEKELGSTARAQEIRELNPETALKTGEIIRLPKN